MKKVLIISASFGSGHVKAAEAVKKALLIRDPTVKVESIDALDYSDVVLKKVLPSLYLNIVNKFPWIWGYIYDRYNYSQEEIKELGVKISEEIKYVIGKSNAAPLIKHIKDFNSQIVVCTHFFPMKIISELKSAGMLNCYLIVNVTDYEIHHYWISPEVDFYTVASEEMKFQLQKRGVSEKRIRVVGIPIDPIFSEQFDKGKIRQKFNLEKSLPAILVLGGAAGRSPFLEIIESLEDVQGTVQILAVAGNNKKLAQKLEIAKAKLKNKITVFGYARNMHELMRVSDILITKAGGLIVSEALSVDLPMLIVSPYPGQEQANADFLIESGAAKIVTNIDLIGYKVNKILSNPEELSKLRVNCHKIAKPQAAKEIADIICTYLNHGRA